MQFSLQQAANETGKSKSTIHRAVKTGKLSSTRNEDGSFSIDAAELFRVFPRSSSEPLPAWDEEVFAKAVEEKTAALLKELALKDEMLQRERESVDDYRKRLDVTQGELKNITEKLTLLAAPPTVPPVVPEATPVKRGLLARILKG